MPRYYTSHLFENWESKNYRANRFCWGGEKYPDRQAYTRASRYGIYCCRFGSRPNEPNNRRGNPRGQSKNAVCNGWRQSIHEEHWISRFIRGYLTVA